MDQNFEVTLQFLLENEAAKEGVKELVDAYEELSKAVEALGPAYKKGSWLYKEAMAPYQDLIKQAIKGQQDLGEANKKTTKTIEEQNKIIQLQINNMRRQAREITANVRMIRDTAQDIDRFARPMAMIGTAVVGGIFAFASKYVKDAKEATAVTIQWQAAQKSLEKSGTAIGAVLAKEALPLLKDAAKYTAMAADILQKNPGIAGAALKGGLILLTLGTIGKAVSSGIRFYADFKLDAAMALQYEAAKLQLQASKNQLEAAGIQAGVSKTKGAAGLSAGGYAGLAVAGFIGTTLAAFLTSGAIDKIEQVVNKKTPGAGGVVGQAASVGLSQLAGGYIPGFGPVISAIDALKKIFPTLQKFSDTKVGGLIDKVLELGKASEKAAGAMDEQTELTEQQINVAKAFGDWRSDDRKIVQDAMDARRKIVEEGERSIVALTERYKNQVISINANATRQAGILMSRYVEESRKAEETYVRERAEIIQDAGEDIQKIEADHQEELRKLAQDHNDAMDDLLADRDALGLVKEQERYDRAREESEREINKEIAERKRETAIRLADLAENFARERQERQRQYQQDIAENAKQRAQALAEAAAQHAAELKQQREAMYQKLRELAEATAQERARRREIFLAQIRDLDASLLGERNTKNSYYQAMLKDAETFMAGYRARLNLGSGTISATATGGSATGGSSTSTLTPMQQAAIDASNFIQNLWSNITTKDTGGYAGKGIYKMAWDGQPEFVMSNSATRAAEEMIGGQLTQERLIAALSAGSRNSVNYNDQRRFNSSISARDRRAILDDTQQLLEGLIRTRG